MYRIGEFSKLSKTTIKALRYYDEVGLLRPAHTDALSGYRFYTTDQLFRLHRIQSLRQIGLSIDDIGLILGGHDPAAILRRRRAELERELTERSLQLSRIDFILLGSEEQQMMNYVATVKEISACTVYTKDLVVPDAESYFRLIPAIGEQLVAKYPALKCATPEYCFICYPDGEYREQNVRIRFCEAVERQMPDFDDVTFRTLEPVTVVSVMHKGPYETLPEAYAFGARWVEENGYVLSDLPRECYIDGIWNQEDPATWLTEIQFPIVSKT